MANHIEKFAPDWVSPPGDTILDLLEEKDWTQVELARRLGISTKHLNQLIKGKTALTEDSALKLEKVLGSTALFWMSREAKYRESLARLEDYQNCEQWISWLDSFPMKDLKKIFFPEERLTKALKPKLVHDLLKFFRVASPDEWRACYASMELCFRRAHKNNAELGSITLWLRMGEIEAEKLELPTYNKIRFEKALCDIRELTVLPPEKFEPKLRQLCNDAGVCLIMVSSVAGARVSGVARWLNPHRPLIQLSLYGKTNDKFWFNFFHEAAHILLHEEEKKAIYLDEAAESLSDSPEEIEANSWAKKYLIPVEFEVDFKAARTEKRVTELASKIGIHPGILVGRLQYEKYINQYYLNELKVSYRLE